MIDQNNNAPRRYFVDGAGRRVLIGLSLEETVEFERLEERAASGSDGLRTSGEPAKMQEARWLELYAKHSEEWKAWMAQSRAERVVDLRFVNYS